MYFQFDSNCHFTVSQDVGKSPEKLISRNIFLAFLLFNFNFNLNLIFPAILGLLVSFCHAYDLQKESRFWTYWAITNIFYALGKGK